MSENAACPGAHQLSCCHSTGGSFVKHLAETVGEKQIGSILELERVEEQGKAFGHGL